MSRTPQDASREEQIKELEEVPEAIRVQIISGEDCDQLATACGEFGRAHTNPIPVNGAWGEFRYLNRLRCSCGAGLIFHRLGSLPVDGIFGNIDVFETVCLQGKHWDILCFHIYHPRRTSILPAGYSFSDFHPVFSKTTWAYGTNRRVSTFPWGLSPLIEMHIGGTLGPKFSRKYEGFVRDRARFRAPGSHIDRVNQVASSLRGYVTEPGTELNHASEIKQNFVSGKDSAKLTSQKQALVRAVIHGAILAISFFNPFGILIKLSILIVLLLLFGMVASSERFKGKL